MAATDARGRLQAYRATGDPRLREERAERYLPPVSYTHLTLPTTPYV